MSVLTWLNSKGVNGLPRRICLGSSQRPRCSNMATYRGRCAECNRTNDRQINRAGRSIYQTKKWKLTRRRKLFLTPLCEYVDPDEGPCLKPATDVHHRQDIAEGGDPWAIEGLEALCHRHHSMIGRARQVARGATA